MAMITIPFLPKPGLVQYLETQCLVDADGQRGHFVTALDLDVSHAGAHAALERVAIHCLEIQPQHVLIGYQVYYRVFNGCQGLDVQGCLDKQVRGLRSSKGWAFEVFVMPAQRSTVEEF